MIGEDFSYDNQLLSSYNMVMCDPEEEQEFVQRAIDRSEITASRSIPNHFSVHYEDTKTLNFFITKDPCEYPQQEDTELSGEEINAIRAWLESPKKPAELIVDDGDDENTTVHYFGLFASVQPFVVDSKCYGLYLTFLCNAPYGFSDEFSTSVSTNGSTTIVNDSAEHDDYLRPVITINASGTFSGSESVTIRNVTDGNRELSINLPSGTSRLVIDCDKRVILNSSGNLVSFSDLGVTVPTTNDYSFINADVYLFYWPRLLPGENTINVSTSSGSSISSITVSGRYAIKSGGF